MHDTNALELGLPKRFTHPDCNPHEFIGKAALERVVSEGGPKRRFAGIVFDDDACQSQGLGDRDAQRPNAIASRWRGKHVGIYQEEEEEEDEEESSVGTLTALAFSPRFGRELGLGILDVSVKPGDRVLVRAEGGELMRGYAARVPFNDDTVQAEGKEKVKEKERRNANDANATKKKKRTERERSNQDPKRGGHSHMRY